MYPVNILRRAEQILGYGVTETAGERVYTVVGDTIYTDLFEGVPTIEGHTGDLTTAFNGNRNTPYFNEIYVGAAYHDGDQFKVTATWGSSTFMSEIDELMQWLQDTYPIDDVDSSNVESKKIEDFNVKFKNSEEANQSKSSALYAGFGFYIRRPLIIDVSSEQKDAWRYF